MKKKTIFTKNKPLAEVVAEAFIFALGTATALLILAALLTIFINLIH